MVRMSIFGRWRKFYIRLGCTKPREMTRTYLITPLLIGLAGVICSSSAMAQSDVGQWSSVMTWPYEAIHAHLLPSGKVMFWDRGDHSQLWDPATNAVTAATPSGANIF